MSAPVAPAPTEIDLEAGPEGEAGVGVPEAPLPAFCRGARGWVATALGAGALIASFPPLGLWPLAFVGPALITLGALGAPTGRAAFLRTTLAGLAFFAAGIAWLGETSLANLIFVTLVEGPLVGLYGWLAHRLLRRGRLFPALPLVWVAHEMVRMSWPLSGFSWLFLGHAQAASPVLVQVADLGGVLAVSFVAACGATVLLSMALGRPGRVGAGSVVIFALLYGLVRPSTLAEPAPGPMLGAVQPGFPQELKDAPVAADVRWQRCRELTRALATGGEPPQLVVWPETMWPWPVLVSAAANAEGGQEPEAAVAALVERDRLAQVPLVQDLLGGFPDRTLLLLGIFGHALESETEGRSVNAALLVDGEGRRLDRYDKSILVPGGEFLPLRDLLPRGLADAYAEWVAGMAGFVPDLAAGPGPRLMELGGLPFGVTICYENVYGDYNRRVVRDGARFLVNLSNEAWFGTSVEFDHMELQSVLRTVETRRAMFRATNSGVSGLVLPDGRRPGPEHELVVDGRDRGVAGVFRARVPLHDDLTIYMQVGDGLGWLALAATLGLFLLRWRGGRTRVS